MAIYQIETDDGQVYEIETDDMRDLSSAPEFITGGKDIPELQHYNTERKAEFVQDMDEYGNEMANRYDSQYKQDMSEQVAEQYGKPSIFDKPAVANAIGMVGKMTEPFTKTIPTPNNPTSNPMFRPQTVMGVGQGVIQPLTAGYGLPLVKKGLSKIGGSEALPPATPTQMGVGQAIGTGVLLAGGKAASGIGKGQALAKVGQGIAQKSNTLFNIAKGSGLGYAYNPSNEEVKGLKDPSRITGAVMGGVAGALPSIVSGIASIPKKIRSIFKTAENTFNEKDFAVKVRANMFDNKKQLGNMVEKAVEEMDVKYPNTKVSLVDEFKKIKNAMDDYETNPGLANDMNGVLRKIKDSDTAFAIRQYIENPEKASMLGSRAVQSIKKAIQQSPVISQKMRQGKFANWTGGERELLDLVDDIRGKQLNTYPELGEKFAEYKDFMRAYDVVKNTFKQGRLLGAVKKNWNDPELKELAYNLLSPDMIDQIGGFRMAKKLIKGAITLGTTAGAGALAYKIFKQ